jgi:MFS family permease
LLLIPRDPTLAFWILVPVLMMDALLNAGINIANQGYLLKFSPAENRTMFLAAGNAWAGLIGGITAVVTGLALSHAQGWEITLLGQTVGPFHVVFATSFLLRIVAVALARRVREPEAQRTPAVLRELLRDFAFPLPRRITTWLAAPASLATDEPAVPRLPTTSVAVGGVAVATANASSRAA